MTRKQRGWAASGREEKGRGVGRRGRVGKGGEEQKEEAQRSKKYIPNLKAVRLYCNIRELLPIGA